MMLIINVMNNRKCYNKSMSKKKSRNGFTLVELSLSVVFISLLSVAVALILSNAISTYHRGVVMNQVNTTGMDLVDDMRAAVQDSGAGSIISACSNMYDKADEINKCEDDHAQNFVKVVKTATVTRKDGILYENIPVQGAFCTGSYSYLWNSGYLLNAEDFTSVENGGIAVGALSLKYRDTKGDEQMKNSFRVLKVKDKNRNVCRSQFVDSYENDSSLNNGMIDIFGDRYDSVMEEPIELLAGGENNLALYDLTAKASAESDISKSVFYSVSFILATVQGGINITASGDYCVTPGDMGSSEVENFNYCAINKFNFAAQANGGD